MIESLEERRLFSAGVSTTTTLGFNSPDVGTGATVILTAHVTASDGSTPTGTVAFIEVIPPDGFTTVNSEINQPNTEVDILDPSTGHSHSALLLGTASLNTLGNAAIMTHNVYGNYAPLELQAVFLGDSPYYVGDSELANDQYGTSVSDTLSERSYQDQLKLLALSTTATNPVIAVDLMAQTPNGFTDTSSNSYGDNVGRINRGDFQSATAGLTINGGGSSNPLGVIVKNTYGYDRQAPAPAGSIRFYEGDNLLATVPFDNDGNVTWDPDSHSLSLGDHLIQAVYDGDLNYFPAEVTQTITITKTPTWSGLYNAATGHPSAQIAEGDKLSLIDYVNTSVKDVVIPAGMVTFSEGDTVLATVPLGQNQEINFALSAGEHTITATYQGDADFLGSSDQMNVEVTSSTSNSQSGSSNSSAGSGQGNQNSNSNNSDSASTETQNQSPPTVKTTAALNLPSSMLRKQFSFSLLVTYASKKNVPDVDMGTIYIDGAAYANLQSNNLAAADIAPSKRAKGTAYSSINLSWLSLGKHKIYVTYGVNGMYKVCKSRMYTLTVTKKGIKLS